MEKKEEILHTSNNNIEHSTYGAETWKTIERQKYRLEAVEMDAVGRSLRISHSDRVKNVRVKDIMGIEGTCKNHKPGIDIYNVWSIYGC